MSGAVDGASAAPAPADAPASPRVPTPPAPGPAVDGAGDGAAVVRTPSRLGSARPATSSSTGEEKKVKKRVTLSPRPDNPEDRPSLSRHSSRPGSSSQPTGWVAEAPGPEGSDVMRPSTRESALSRQSAQASGEVSLENNPSMLDENQVTTATEAPRYAMPNVASMLPAYLNSEQEFIYRSFHTGNYDDINDLPETLNHQQVIRQRQQTMEAARKMIAPCVDSNGRLVSLPAKAVTEKGLFSEFEYIPSSFAMADEIATMERAQHKAAVQQVAGVDFLPTINVYKGKHEDVFEAGKTYPYMSDPYDARDQLALRAKWIHESKCLGGPIVPPGATKQEDQWPIAPSKHLALESMAALRNLILEDWDESEISIYPNEHEVWVIRFKLDTVDSEKGLVAYMNILVRCNPLVNKYNLVKVVEHWNVKPGDGYVYFTLRPPWVRQKQLATFYTLHPEERSYPTKVMFEAEARAARKAAEAAARDAAKAEAAAAEKIAKEREEAANAARIELISAGSGGRAYGIKS